jgi:hypothetical protein
MNRVITVAVLATLSFSFASSAASLSIYRRNSLEQTVDAFEKAYIAGDLGSLDRQFPRRICANGKRSSTCTGSLTIQIKHSLRPDDHTENISFSSFAAAEKWLRKSRHGGMISRSVKPRQKCEQGVCSYDFSDGISHNHLYVKSIKYGYINYRDADDYYIKEIYLLDGD